jgi:predicted SAM-dependent methyltransferase
MTERPLRRLHWGCGDAAVPGWINSDRRPAAGVDLVRDIVRDGLSLDADGLDYAVSVHALQEVPLADIVPVLQELHRVLKPRGVLRLVLPDLEKGIQAYLRDDRDYFLIPDEDYRSLGGKFVAHLLWYGHSRVLFTFDFVEELLLKAGFTGVMRCCFGQTYGPHPGIVDLDNREAESLYVEAVK